MPYKIPLLQADDIEVKVKKVTEKGAVALLYKTARTDMNMLDDVFGAENWSCEYAEVKGNLYCTIRVRNEHGEWVGKQDCGIESREDGDGNEKKGEASDAFKRAGFRWGIGRELYTAPFTFLPLETYKDGSGYKLKNQFERFAVKDIGYDENRRINRLVITNDKGVVMYTMGGKSVQRKASIPAAMRPDPKNDPPIGGFPEEKQEKPLICEVCGSTIVGTKANTKEQYAAGTKKATGMQMCGVCYKAWRAQEAAEAAASAEHDDAGDR